MQKVIQLGQVRPVVLSNLETTAKNWKASVASWLQGKSETFSSLCGEDFTRREVLLAHAVAVGLQAIAGIGGAL